LKNKGKNRSVPYVERHLLLVTGIFYLLTFNYTQSRSSGVTRGLNQMASLVKGPSNRHSRMR